MATLASKIAEASKVVGGQLEADKRNAQQNYDYVSADKILSKCGQALAGEGVSVFPSITSQDVETVNYTDNYGKQKTRFDASVALVMFVSDGEQSMELTWAGRGSDFGVPDKALYKAITTGHKYFLAKLLNVGAGNEDGEHETPESVPAAPPRRHAKQAAQVPSSLGDVEPDAGDVDAVDGTLGDLRDEFYSVGQEKYGDEWDDKRHAFCAAMKVPSSNELSAKQLRKLIDGMRKK